MNSRRPGSSRGPTRPGARKRTTAANTAPSRIKAAAVDEKSDKPRLKAAGRTRRTLVVGAQAGKPRAFSLRFLAILLFAMLAVIVIAPTLSNYLDQQQQLRELNSSVENAEARIRALQTETMLWNDDDYVAAQARERLGYVRPGEVLYVVNDPEEGTAEDHRRALEIELEYNRRAATPWFTTMWDSVSIAGYSSGDEGEAIDPTDVVSPAEKEGSE